MDSNAYHRAWMSGATEAIRTGEEAFFENMIRSAADREGYKMIEREVHEHEQRLIEEHEQQLAAECKASNNPPEDVATGSSQCEGYPPGWWHCTIHLNPSTGEMHSDGDHRVRTWIQERIQKETK